MSIKELREKTRLLMQQHPEHKDDFQEFYYLALDEIEDGQSEQHECDIAYESMRQLLEL
jgi:hypothetical protein